MLRYAYCMCLTSAKKTTIVVVFPLTYTLLDVGIICQQSPLLIQNGEIPVLIK